MTASVAAAQEPYGNAREASSISDPLGLLTQSQLGDIQSYFPLYQQIIRGYCLSFSPSDEPQLRQWFGKRNMPVVSVEWVPNRNYWLDGNPSPDPRVRVLNPQLNVVQFNCFRGELEIGRLGLPRVTLAITEWGDSGQVYQATFYKDQDRVQAYVDFYEDSVLGIHYVNPDVESWEKIYPPAQAKQVRAKWESKRKPGLVIGIVDSGLDYNHPQLARFIKREDPGYDFIETDQLPYDGTPRGTYHGTHVASIAVRGLEDVQLISLRVIGKSLKKIRPEDVDFEKAIDYAYDRGARLFNISLAIDTESWCRGLREAMEKHPDALFVAAAGNDSHDLTIFPEYPASFSLPNLIVVADACDGRDGCGDGVLWEYSNYGKDDVDLAAYGVNILGALPNRQEGLMSGTSMAAPQVTHTAAAIKLAHPELTMMEIRRIILQSAVFFLSLKDKVRTGGLLDEAAALRSADRFAVKGE